MLSKVNSGNKLFTKPFLLGTLVNALLAVNYFVPMVSMATFCAVTFDVSPEIAGLAASIFIIGATISRVLSAPIIGRLGERGVLVGGTFAMTAMSACYFLDAGIAVLYLVRLVHGFAFGMSQCALTAAATRMIPSERKGEGIGYFMLSVTFGSAVGPFLGLSLMDGPGFPAIFALCVGLGIAASAGAIAFPVPRVIANELKCDARHVASTEEKAIVSKRISALVEPRVLPICTVIAITYLGYGVVITYMSAFSEAAGTQEGVRWFFIVYAVTMAISRPFTGRALDRYGDGPIMTSAFLAFAAGLAIFALVLDNLAVMVAACLMGYGIGVIQPSGLTLAICRADDSRLGIANSTFFMSTDASIGICPILLGWIIPIVGYSGLYLAACGLGVIAFGCYWAFKAKKMI